MPGTICSVALCRSNSAVSKKKGETISFFTFPKNEALRKEWVRKCFRKDKFNPDNKRVCSKHFRMCDFEDVVAAKLKNTVPRRLKCNAVPSLYLLPKHYVSDHVDERSASDEEREVRVRKALVEELLATAAENERRKQNENFSDACAQTTDITNSGLPDRYNQLIKENQSLKDKVEMYEHNLLELARTKEKLQVKLTDIENKFDKRIRDLFSEVFTNNQLDIILKRCDKPRWTDDEMTKAFTLKCISKRAYLYVSHRLKYPLPSYASLLRWKATKSFV